MKESNTEDIPAGAIFSSVASIEQLRSLQGVQGRLWMTNSGGKLTSGKNTHVQDMFKSTVRKIYTLKTVSSQTLKVGVI